MVSVMKSRGVALGAFLAWLCLLCMCSSEAPRPPAFGNCDAGCDPVSGTGGSSPGGGGIDAGTGTTMTGDASVCGIADSQVRAPDALCAPCIIENCCTQDTSCTDNCTALLDCTQSCAVGDTICVGGCENMWTAGFTAYQAFALCLQQSCMNTCPALQQ
jgi:hypothetical protein